MSSVTSPDCRPGIWVDQLLGIGGNGGDSRTTASCPDDRKIVGFQAAAMCFGITVFQVRKIIWPFEQCMLNTSSMLIDKVVINNQMN